jgi:osmotically inducible protein OsmC
MRRQEFGSELYAPPNMNRSASVVWEGNLRDGIGAMSTESGVLFNTQYSFRTRFEEGIGTNPDELIAASLGGCFSMALSHELELAGLHSERIETTATATLEELAAGWTLTRVQLDVHAKVPRATQGDFIDAALAAKTKCPMARLLNANISMNARLDT